MEKDCNAEKSKTVSQSRADSIQMIGVICKDS
jgi:hypothetical protein